MSTLSIRLSERLDEHLTAESRLAGQPKSLIARNALEQFLRNRRRERFLAQLIRAAAAINSDESAALVEEALPFDNEALESTEGDSKPGSGNILATRPTDGA